MLDFGCDGIEDCIQRPLLPDASDLASFDSDIVGDDICDDGGSGRGTGADAEPIGSISCSVPSFELCGSPIATCILPCFLPPNAETREGVSIFIDSSSK
jgi:hypothetical protein